VYERKKVLSGFYDSCEFFDKTVKENIEKYRKGEVKIFVVNKDGSPIKDAQITLNQLTHHFKFGANIFMLDELETEEKNRNYRDTFKSVFNMATLPFYWNSLEEERGKPRYAKDSPKYYRRPPIDLCMEYCLENGIEPREHALAYERMFPAWLKDASVPAMLTVSEESRRMEEMMRKYAMQGGGALHTFPVEYTLTVNTASPLTAKLLGLCDTDAPLVDIMASQIYRLALLSQRKLIAEELNGFLADSFDLLGRL
jgi:hypothetical protein